MRRCGSVASATIAAVAASSSHRSLVLNKLDHKSWEGIRLRQALTVYLKHDIPGLDIERFE